MPTSGSDADTTGGSWLRLGKDHQSSPSFSSNVGFQSCQLSVHIFPYPPGCCQFFFFFRYCEHSNLSIIHRVIFRVVLLLEWWSPPQLHIPVRTGGIFYFPWHRHQIEGTDGFERLLRKTLAKGGKRNCQKFRSEFFRCGIRTRPAPSGRQRKPTL